MSVSLYDLLDVEPDASEAEIRTAWKAAIADLGPGDRRFRAYNEAAEVLLDPGKRAAYDAELAGTAEPAVAEPPPAAHDPEPAPILRPAPETETETAPPTKATKVRNKAKTKGQSQASATKLGSGSKPVLEPKSDPEASDEEATDGRAPVATWLLAAVGLVAAAVLAVTIVMWLTTDLSDDAAAADTEDSSAAALTAAEEAAVPVLSYDYRTFDEDVIDAQSYMTDEHKVDHNDLMGELKPDATTQKLVVGAEFKGSGIVRVTGDRADILVMVNQVVERTGAEPFVLPVWATLQMVEEDGDWLVDKIINEGAVGA